MRTLSLCALLMCASFLVQAAPRPTEWAEPVAPASNLYRVTPTFYRSAKLEKPDVERAKTLGIRTIVSLRAWHSDAKVLDGSGIKRLRIRINTWHIRDREIIKALRAIREAEKDGPVLLHCLHGADRTGLVTAMHRMVFQGWTREQARDELKNGGYGYHAVWKNIEHYLRHVDADAIRKQLAKDQSKEGD
jgi:protein tyrosine/serine phosphatase